MDDPSAYSTAINLCIRCLGAIYVIAYFPFLFQIRGLIGIKGILPAKGYLEAARKHYGHSIYYKLPNFFWWSVSDTALIGLIWAGIFLGMLLACGYLSALVLILLFFIHLNLVTIGQDFLSFGWESFLMELTVGAALLIATVPYNLFAWVGFNFLLFRFFVEAGASKLLSGDENWRNLTATSFHYLTQPLPNTWAWYMHKLPMWFHKFSCGGTLFIELIIPFAIFLQAEMRLMAFFALFLLQFAFWFAGNLSYLNYLSIVATLPLIHNDYLAALFHVEGFVGEPSSTIWYACISVLAIAYLLMQVAAFCFMFTHSPWLYRILAVIRPFHIATPHGIFAVMTTRRLEIIVEGSHDGLHWQTYEFRYKPGNMARRPRRIAPYQPRLDWQAWFLPFAPFEQQEWFQLFLVRLLQGSREVSYLLKVNPFLVQPPAYVRALLYDYEFTSWQEKKVSGNYWKRKLIGTYCPPIKLTASDRLH